MKIIFKKMLLRVKGVKNELAIAFGLILLGILVFLGYLFPGVSSFFEARNSLHLIVLIVIFMLAMSFIIIVQIIEPILKISGEAKRIAEGDLSHDIELFRDDEIGDLGTALNHLTHRIKDNLEELKTFKKNTEDMNAEINKRIDILSDILEVSSLIAQNAPIKEIFEAGINKCVTMGTMTFGCMILKERDSGDFQVQYLSGPQADELTEKGIQNQRIQLGKGFLGRAMLRPDIVVVDKNTESTAEIEEFKKMFLLANAVIMPISSKGNIYGLLIAGNNYDNFGCPVPEQELFKVISKQFAIAIANDRVAGEIKKLDVMDSLTGLFNQSFIRGRLKEEIKRAMDFKRPCSFVLLSVDNYTEFHKKFGNITAEESLVRIGTILRDHLTGLDKAGRFADSQFAVILPDKNKRQSIEVAERMRVNIELLFSKETDAGRRLTCTGVVTENPLDGMTAEELIVKAEEVLYNSDKESRNKILYKI